MASERERGCELVGMSAGALIGATAEEIDGALDFFLKNTWVPSVEAHGELPGVDPDVLETTDQKRLFLLLACARAGGENPYVTRLFKRIFELTPGRVLAELIQAHRAGILFAG